MKMYVAVIYEDDTWAKIAESYYYCHKCLYVDDEDYNLADMVFPTTYDGCCDLCGNE